MLVLEFTVEPFAEGDPGPHVQAAVRAAAGPDVHVEVGPFGTVVTGADQAVLVAVDAVMRAAVGAGASQVSLRVGRPVSGGAGPTPEAGPTTGS